MDKPLKIQPKHKISSSKREKLEGTTIGNYKILRYIGDKKYECECQCDNKTVDIVYASSLKKSTYPCCKKCRAQRSANEQRKHLEGTTDYNWKYLEYVGKSRYKCLCLLCKREFIIDSREIIRGHSKCCKECSGNALKDLTNQIFGSYKALEYIGDHYWKCLCLKCNREFEVTSNHLTSGQSTQCKECALKEMKKQRHNQMLANWANKKFGELTPIEYIESTDSWICKCSCDDKTIVVARGNLVSGHVRSCGCKTHEFKNNTMMLRYGDTASRRIGNPRDIEKIEILEDATKFKNIVNLLHLQLGRKPTSYELSDALDVTYGTICARAKQYDIDLYQGNCSNQELQFINEFPDARTHNRDILPGYELDFYFPDKKLAVEMNGDFWHSSLFKSRNYHQYKTIECAKKGIRLIHIFEHEWLNLNTRRKLISLIKNDTREFIYGRHLDIIEIDNIKANQFLDEYHLQNGINSSINIGAYYNGELVGVMSFGKPRFNNNYQYELYRLCWKSNYAVVGGSEKMFKYFIETHNTESIITYVDISKFTGNSYFRMGFKSIQPNPISEPNYVWINFNSQDILSRYQTQKHKLLEAGLGTEEQTEDDIMYNMNYLKVYDSGNLRLEWKKEFI